MAARSGDAIAVTRSLLGGFHQRADIPVHALGAVYAGLAGDLCGGTYGFGEIDGVGFVQRIYKQRVDNRVLCQGRAYLAEALERPAGIDRVFKIGQRR